LDIEVPYIKCCVAFANNLYPSCCIVYIIFRLLTISNTMQILCK
jgi:hypothetical protein